MTIGTESVADFYRRLHVGNPGDVEFYQKVCRGAPRVLELGCGWGRITSRLAREGNQVAGVDKSEAFISWARKEVPQAHFEVVDVTSPEVSFLEHHAKTYDRVIIPYNTLYSLGGEDGARKCLQLARECLRANGEVWLDAYDLDELHEARENEQPMPEDDGEPVALWPRDSSVISVFEDTTFAQTGQSLVVEYRAVCESEILARLSMRHDYLTSTQIVELMSQADLELFAYLHGFSNDDETEFPQLVFGARTAP